MYSGNSPAGKLFCRRPVGSSILKGDQEQKCAVDVKHVNGVLGCIRQCAASMSLIIICFQYFFQGK